MGRKTWFEAVLGTVRPSHPAAQIALFNKLVTNSKSSWTRTRATDAPGQEQPAATEERTPSSKAAPTKSKGQVHGALGRGSGHARIYGRRHVRASSSFESTHGCTAAKDSTTRKDFMKGNPQVSLGFRRPPTLRSMMLQYFSTSAT